MARVLFVLNHATTEVNSSSLDTSFTVWAGVAFSTPKLGKVKDDVKPGEKFSNLQNANVIEYDYQAGQGKGYSISLGHEMLFGGNIPPIRNDLRTPEDDFAVHQFSFRPYVYKECYTVAKDNACYYAMNYAVIQ